MIPIEIQKTLLGESLSLIAEVGPRCWLLYQLIRSNPESVDDQWAWSSPNREQAGSALVCAIDFRDWKHQDLFAKHADIVAAANSLMFCGWLFDYSFKDSKLEAVVGVDGDFLVYALDSKVQKESVAVRRLQRINLGSMVQKVEPDSSRVARARASKDLAQGKSDKIHEATVAKVKAKAMATPKPYGHTGEDWADPRWSDSESPFGVALTLEGLYHLFEVRFEQEFKHKVSVYTRGRPNKKAFKLKAVADDYDVSTAMSAVIYAFENWGKLKELLRISKPPTPDMIWYLRDELCYPMTQSLDPIEELMKVKGPKDDRKRQIEKDEYKKRDDDKGVGW